MGEIFRKCIQTGSFCSFRKNWKFVLSVFQALLSLNDVKINVPCESAPGDVDPKLQGTLVSRTQKCCHNSFFCKKSSVFLKIIIIAYRLNPYWPWNGSPCVLDIFEISCTAPLPSPSLSHDHVLSLTLTSARIPSFSSARQPTLPHVCFLPPRSLHHQSSVPISLAEGSLLWWNKNDIWGLVDLVSNLASAIY